MAEKARVCEAAALMETSQTPAPHTLNTEQPDPLLTSAHNLSLITMADILHTALSIVSLRASPDFCGHMQTGPKRDVLLCSEKCSSHPAGLIKELLFALNTTAVSYRPASVFSTQFRREDSQNFKVFGLSDFYPASKQRLLWT